MPSQPHRIPTESAPLAGGATARELAIIYSQLFQRAADTGPFERLHTLVNVYATAPADAQPAAQRALDEYLSELYSRGGGAGPVRLNGIQLRALTRLCHQDKIFAALAPSDKVAEANIY